MCQPLFYDHQNTLHTAITWYVHSTSFLLDESKTDFSSCEEWGQINDTFYKWPLYKCYSSDEEDNCEDDLIGNFMHRYFDGDLTTESNPLLAQLPNHVVDSLLEKIVPLTTIHIPLFPRQINHNDHDGYHTFAHKEDIITIENATIICCRGLRSMCSCKEVKFRQISFKRTPKSTDYPIEGLYLNRWPYVHHGPGEHNYPIWSQLYQTLDNSNSKKK